MAFLIFGFISFSFGVLAFTRGCDAYRTADYDLAYKKEMIAIGYWILAALCLR